MNDVHSLNSDNIDINTIFENILLAEEKISEQSYKQGYSHGIREGITVEGYHLGYHRGAEIGAEIGYIQAFTEYYLNDSEKIKISQKTVKKLETLQEYLDNFPHYNSNTIDLVNELEKIKCLYKNICAQLKIKEELTKEALTF